MGFKCGIVGLPNVGKSTLFNALTHSSVKADNFPFCTIQSNIGTVPIFDIRLKKLANIVKPKRLIPSTMEFVDIAGLIKGASKGEGLGNRFLSNIRKTEMIIHVVRCFKNADIVHTSGKINPVKDIEIINIEMALSDLKSCENALQRIQKRINIGDKNAKLEKLVLEKCQTNLENFGMLRTLSLNSEEIEVIRYINFLTLKPIMYIANINESDCESNPYLDQVSIFAEKEGSKVIPICATLESDISKLRSEERTEFMENFGIKESGLNRITSMGHTLLNLQTYFTAGIKEVRAWTIPSGTTALKAASKIHSDIEKGFIRAQTISFDDFITYNGEQGAKAAGKMRYEGKEYLVKNGDVMHFLFKV